jgi:hypothetical protein
MKFWNRREKTSRTPAAIERRASSSELAIIVPSDEERSVIVEALTDATVQGRLSYDDLERATEEVMTAPSLASVNSSISQLPVRIETPSVRVVPVSTAQQRAEVPTPTETLPPMPQEFADAHRRPSDEVRGRAGKARKWAIATFLGAFASLSAGVLSLWAAMPNPTDPIVGLGAGINLAAIVAALTAAAVHNRLTGGEATRATTEKAIAADIRHNYLTTLLPAYARFTAQAIPVAHDVAVSLIRWDPQHPVGEFNTSNVRYRAIVVDTVRVDSRRQADADRAFLDVKARAQEADLMSQRIYEATLARDEADYRERLRSARRFQLASD